MDDFSLNEYLHKAYWECDDYYDGLWLGEGDDNGWDPSEVGDYEDINDGFDSQNEDYSEWDPSESEPFGWLVERLRCPDKDASNCKDAEAVAECEIDMWTRLPDEVMMSIVARLPFSSVCCFRSVCKKWKALVVYPDPSLMTMRDPSQVPLCVISSGPNQLASYNPSSHSWHQMPARFGSSFGVLGFQGEEGRVVAGAGGLLVLESRHRHLGLWVVNPVNKFERQLPPPPIPDVLRGVSVRDVHFRLDKDDSYQVFVVFQATHYVSPGKDSVKRRRFRDLQIYRSQSDSWERSNKWGQLVPWQIVSTVEYDGDLCCLALTNSPNGLDPCATFTMRLDLPEFNPRTENETTEVRFWEADNLPLLPDGLEHGQLFVKDRRLMLGGVTFTHFGAYGSSNMAEIHLWKLNSSKSDWAEVACMPQELMGILSFDWEPRVAVHGDYMCVTNSILSDKKEAEAGVDHDGVMCHIPSHRWWKLPRYWNNPKLRVDFHLADKQTLYREFGEFGIQRDCTRTLSPFLFEPRMDLVP